MGCCALTIDFASMLNYIDLHGELRTDRKSEVNVRYLFYIFYQISTYFYIWIGLNVGQRHVARVAEKLAGFVTFGAWLPAVD